MNIDRLEENIQSLVTNLTPESFIYDLLLAYEQPKASITRLKKGDYNLSKKEKEVLWKKKLFFRNETESDLHILIDKLKNDSNIIKHHPRFIIVTDFHTLLSVDTKNKDSLDIPIIDLSKHYDFFLPWAGLEKSQLQSENPADIKAAERMGRLYDLILEDNPVKNESDRHALNNFLSRLLFCFFAEDTGIFNDGLFTNALASHTAQDGSDLQTYLQKLFVVLNSQKRTKYPQFLQNFPYVNGGLFNKDHRVPTFSAKSRHIIIECGSLNWKAINPDIFGSMMQAVVHSDQRSSMGMHYTSVVNIMKVIKPLFLDDLYAELEQAGNNKKKLRKLLDRLCHLRIFDPACGSGNFLIIAYKELCKLEIEVLKRLHGKQKTFRFFSNIKLTQFYGIELDDFAHETAKLSMWLAEHQMNLSFKEVFGVTRPTLPLQDGGHIICGNATRLDWEEVCPKAKNHEIYILGNPPYLGARMQNKHQKADIKFVMQNYGKAKKIDYIVCWFIKATEYIKGTEAKFAFVSTNSICQGEQVPLVWPYILSKQVEIYFAHTSFKWANNAKGSAGVTCIVVGLRNITENPKILYTNAHKTTVKNINPYLRNASDLYIVKRNKSLSNFPQMHYGNMAIDGGNLLLSCHEKTQLIKDYPDTVKIIKKVQGAQEFLKGIERWCLWIDNKNLSIAKSVPCIETKKLAT